MHTVLSEHDIKQLHHNRWFAQLAPRFQAHILENARYRHFEKDAAIFHSGDTFDGLYAVLKGSVRLGYIDVQGQEAVAAIVAPIMWFGEISLVDAQPRSHDAICVQKTTVLYLAQSSLHELLQKHPEFWKHIAELTSQKLRYAFLELIAIQTQSLQQRIAQRLCFILNGYGNHLSIEHLEIQLSQEQLGQMLVCSRQTVNQELQILEKKGIIQIAFKKIKIVDLSKLHQLAHQTQT